MACQICNKEVYIPLNRQIEFKYCSHSCKAKDIFNRPEVRIKIIPPSGDKSRLWKGGITIDHGGYRLITINKEQIKEHRYVMEQFLERKLKPTEIIHHINGVKTDNRIENLVLTNQSEHIRDHQTLKDKWSKKYTKCLQCGTTAKRHEAKGLCRNCWRNECSKCINCGTIQKRHEAKGMCRNCYRIYRRSVTSL